MKSLIIAIPIIVIILINQDNESETNSKPIAKETVKNNKIINTYKHPYYERYINYLDLPNITYTNHSNILNSEGC